MQSQIKNLIIKIDDDIKNKNSYYKSVKELEDFFKNSKTLFNSDLFEWMLEISKSNSTAKRYLGRLYKEGLGTTQDNMKTLESYKSSANSNNPLGQFALGFLYDIGDIGKIVDRDHNRACELYKLSASQGCCEAQNNLARMYKYGFGVEKDEKKAIELYELSAAQGHYVAQYNLGELYYKGKIVEKNYKLAIYYINLSAFQGFDDAKKFLKDHITLMIEQLSKIYTELETTKKKLSELDNELIELRLSAPIEGGPDYQKALASFNEKKKKFEIQFE